MHLKRVYQAVNKVKVMCHWINHTYGVLFYWYSLYGSIRGPVKNVLSCIIARIRGYFHEVQGINSAILLHLFGYDAKLKVFNNISLKCIMLTDNTQTFINWFVIIHRHLTKVSAQIIQCIIFERNKLSITLSTLWCYFLKNLT